MGAIFKSRFGAKFVAEVLRKVEKRQRFLVESLWEIEHFRKGKLIDHTIDHNICTDEGLNGLLDVMFHGSTQITTWYVGIFETDTTPAAGTTYATPVFTWCTSYDEATRPEFTEAAANSKSMTNSANKATFTISATKTIYGGGLVGGGTGASTKGDTAGGGKLFAASKFASPKACVDDDVLLVTVTLTAADA